MTDVPSPAPGASKLLAPGPLILADYAWVNEPGSPADKVAAAIYAYTWAVKQVGTLNPHMCPTLPSWLEHRATLPERIR